MIIGNNNNNNFTNQTFIKSRTSIQKNNELNQSNPINHPINPMIHSNVLSKKEMHEKSLQMLQSRLQNGLITVEDFNKKVRDLTKHE